MNTSNDHPQEEIPVGGRMKSSDNSATNESLEIDEDDAVQIDLALNTNYDPSFFDVVGGWSDSSGPGGTLPATGVGASSETQPKSSQQQQQHLPSTLPLAVGPSEQDNAAARFASLLLQNSSPQPQQAQLQQPARSAVDPVISDPAAIATAATLAVQQQPPPQMAVVPPTFFPAQQQQQQLPSQQQGSAATTTAASTTPPSAELPPFLLFDAPIELRANFMSAQRAHGLPTLQDSNTAHYQQHLQQQQQRTRQQQQQPRLIDGRHGDVNKKDRNVREQKRTQKIADLIDQLRVKMEKGGWKVGVKSKFHTLSSCAEYVKHLVEVNKEKEKALEKIKRDLEEKRRQMEEETNNPQIPSDRESTTSSLTASSGFAEDQQQQPQNSKKRDMPHDISSSESMSRKKPAYATTTTTASTSNSNQDSSHASSNSSGQRDGQSMDANRMTSSVSDLTDSNKEGSSSEGNSSDQQDQQHKAAKKETRPNGNSNTEGEVVTTGSIVSDAAVAPGVGSHVEITTPAEHVAVVRNGGGGGGVHNSTSNGTSNFELDYKEVFLKSNIPQIISTTSGRIIAWNDFFLKATGLEAEEANRLTIFSLVRSNKLASLFEIVAASLRAEDLARSQDTDTASTGTTRTNFTAITLPCTSFRSEATAGTNTSSVFDEKPLYMTVTLMRDEDPRKRCFHVVFTDCPGTNGTLGMVTQELLAKLFSRPGSNTSDTGSA